MGFLNPLNLLFGLSLAVLILIYVRSQSRGTLEVSSLMLFDEVPAPVAKVRLVRLDLLFWLEALALGSLALAIAGLYLRMPAAAEHTRRHALVFDLGAAMGALEGRSTRLDRAVAEALAMVGSAPAGEEFSVIGYAQDAQVRRAPSADRALVRESLGALAPLDVPARPAALGAALMRAREADTIDLFADRIPPGDLPAGAGLNLRTHIVGAPADNLALVSLDPGSVGATRGHCVIRNFSARPRLCELAIDCDGEPVFDSGVMLEPHAQAIVPFGPLARGGLIHARIATPDPLMADNQRWAWTPSDAPAKVMVVSADPAVRDDLARVVLAVNQNAIVSALDPKHLEAAPEDLQLAVMHDFYDPRIKAAARLFVYPPTFPSFRVRTTVASAELRERAGAGPLAQPILLGPARALTIPDWMDTIAAGAGPASAGSIPMAAIGRDRSGPLGVIAFDVRDHLLLDPDRLDALVLTVDLVKQLIAPDTLQVVSTGSYVSAPAIGSARVIAPDSSASMLKADSSGRIRFRALKAGRYRVESGGRTIEVMANYFDAAESDLGAHPPTSQGAARSVTVQGWAPISETQVRSMEPALIGLALIAFLVESAFLIRRAAGWGWRRV